MKIENGAMMSTTQLITALNMGRAVLVLDDPAGPTVLAPEDATVDELAAGLPSGWTIAPDAVGTHILFSKIAYRLTRLSRP